MIHNCETRSMGNFLINKETEKLKSTLETKDPLFG